MTFLTPKRHLCCGRDTIECFQCVGLLGNFSGYWLEVW